MIGAIGAIDTPIGTRDRSSSSLGGTTQLPCVRGGQISFRGRSFGLFIEKRGAGFPCGSLFSTVDDESVPEIQAVYARAA